MTLPAMTANARPTGPAARARNEAKKSRPEGEAPEGE
jgi:hypothetical protein